MKWRMLIIAAWYLWSYEGTVWKYVNGFDTKRGCIAAKGERISFKCRPTGTLYFYLV